MDLAFCEICGKQWAALDPGVRYVHGDGRWECADEVACFDRRAMQQETAGWVL
jgi:alpha-D-ribose 1-methylphosphonate 5-phosphate C-P lyase